MTEKDQPALETPVGFDAEVKEIEHFTTRDAAIGEMLEVHTTPEEQRKVLFNRISCTFVVLSMPVCNRALI